MNSIYVFSGPCGCGKSTLAEAYGMHLAKESARNQVYVIHGDQFHQGFLTAERQDKPDCAEFLYWPDILRFNWSCILSVAQKVLDRGLDVIIDYVVEEELPLLQELAHKNGARLFYVVLTAPEQELRRRLTWRGNPELIARALFLKDKLDHAPEHQKYQYDITGKTVKEEVEQLDMARHEVRREAFGGGSASLL